MNAAKASELPNESKSVSVCIICGVEYGCRKPCCNMGSKVCYCSDGTIGKHVFRVRVVSK